jgi:hypothetical protein
MAPEPAFICAEVSLLIWSSPDHDDDDAHLLARYASDLTPDQKEALLDVVRAHPHAQIGPEVRRELVNSVVRGAPRPDADVEMS